jgi:glycosyltransferase involved in cell wall biosynthesis
MDKLTLKKILFVGSFLSKKRKSLSVSESLANNLASEGWITQTVSSFENKILRFFDITFRVLFSQYDVVIIEVYSGNAFKWAWLASNLAVFKKKYIILTLHGGKLPEFYLNQKTQIDKVFKKAKIISSPSLYLNEYFTSLGYTIRYIPNSIDLSNFPTNRSIVKDKSFLWVRAFVDIYNPEIAINTLKLILVKYPEATLTMVGPDHGLMESCKELSKNLGVYDKINFAGPIENSKLYKYFQTHEVYINTTSYESFGVALMEAASCGIPIVSTNVGELPYIWKDRSNIILTKSITDHDFFESIDELFQNKKLQEDLSSAALLNVRNYSWERISPIWKSFLK